MTTDQHLLLCAAEECVEAQAVKREKVLRMLRYSEERGTLRDDDANKSDTTAAKE